jgi:hypothetical protein
VSRNIRATLITALFALAAAPGAHAGLFNEIRYELSVLDEAGKPLEGATVWYFGDSAKRSFATAEDMRILVRRHQRDVDFIFEGSLIDVLLIERTDASGKARVLREWQELEGARSATTQIAVLKRGRIPEVLSRTSRRGARERITVRLTPDASWPVDPRLERLDQLRSATDAIRHSDDLMTVANQRKLVEISAQLRGLARELERDGRPDDAAAVYYNLAHMPGVTVDAGDGVTVLGYSNGFDDKSAQRVADRAQAWRLVTSHPSIAYEAVLERYRAEGIDKGPSATRDDSRRRYLADTEQWLRDYPEQIWPIFRLYPISIYGMQGDAVKACAAIKDLHAFAPALLAPDHWRYELRMWAVADKSSNPPGWTCEIPGLGASNDPAPP